MRFVVLLSMRCSTNFVSPPLFSSIYTVVHRGTYSLCNIYHPSQQVKISCRTVSRLYTKKESSHTMELRKCEDQVDELATLYESLRGVSGIASLPKLDHSDNKQNENPESNNNNANVEISSSLEATVNLLHQMQASLQELAPRMDKFQKRLMEKDKVTGNPRYGEKTQQRVDRILKIYNLVKQSIPSSPDGDNEEDNTNPLLQLKEQYHRQHQALEQEKSVREQQEQLAKQQEIERQQKLQKEEELRQHQQKEQEELALRQEQALLHQQAQQVREARLLQQQKEQQWFDGITKGAEGVKLYLAKLKESTAKEPPGVQAMAFQSLLRIYQQISAHPEEAKFRRIRRSHERFVQDVGRHEGGVEVLIAGGFVLGAIDDVPSYLSKEPDIEKEMDGWSAWFDLNKVTLELLEQAVQELS
jgi:hypothetical protein